MGKINREELFKILDEQYTNCKARMLLIIEDKIKDLEEYKGDVIDITTEISMGNSLEGGKLFRSVDEDYYDKQKLLSVPTKSDTLTLKGGNIGKLLLDPDTWPKIDSDNIWHSLNKTIPQAPNKHKKKYLIKLSNKYPPSELAEIGKIITENQIFVYNKDVIEQIITLDVE